MEATERPHEVSISTEGLVHMRSIFLFDVISLFQDIL